MRRRNRGNGALFRGAGQQSSDRVNGAIDAAARRLLVVSGSIAPEADSDCQDLVNRIQPSRKKLEDWLWGRVPYDSAQADVFYLVLTGTRMEPTYAAEGDYDYGTVTFGSTEDGETSFTLVPDDHPDMLIDGSIVAKPASDVIIVSLRDIPAGDGKKDRTLYYCRFEEPAAEG